MKLDTIDLALIFAALFVAFVVGVLVGRTIEHWKERFMALLQIVNAQRRVEEDERTAVKNWMQEADKEKWPNEL